MDVATLGLEVRSQGVGKGAKDLNDLSAAAKRAEGAGSALKAGFAAVVGILSKIEAAVSAVERHTMAMAAAMNHGGATVSQFGSLTGAATARLEAYQMTATTVTTKLGGLSAATQAVAAATSNAAAATADMSSAAGAAAGAINNQGAAATQTANAMRTVTAAANQNKAAISGSIAPVGNLAAQFQDIGVSAAMAMNPLQIALQQGTQISAVLGPMGAAGAAKALGQAFLSIISPVSLLTIVIVALLAAGLQMVDWASGGEWALNKLADAIEAVAPAAAVAAAGIALLYAPAVISGITSVIALVSRLTVTVLGLAAAWAMANPAAAIIAGLVAAGAAAVLFRDELANIFGRDIVGDVKKAVNYVIGSFVAAYHDIEYLWKNFPDLIAGAVIGAVNAMIRGINTMMQKAAEGFDWLVEKGNLESLGIGKFGQVAPIAEMANPAADRNQAAAIRHGRQQQEDLSRDYLGDLYEAATRGASAFSDKLRELAKSLTEVEEKKKKGKTEAEKMAERYADLVRSADQFIAAQRLEQEVLGMTEQAANALRYEQELLNRAANDNIKLTPQQTAELKGLANTMADVEAETKAMQKAIDFAKDLTRGFIDDMRAGLEQGKGFWRSFADAVMNVLNKIIDKILNQLVDAIFRAAGKGGGIFGSLFGGGGPTNIVPVGYSSHTGGIVGMHGTPRAINPAVFAGAPRMHSGGVAGLRHDEVPTILQRGEVVIPRGAARGGSSINVQVINNAPVDVKTEKRQDANGMEQLLLMIDQRIDQKQGEIANPRSSGGRAVMSMGGFPVPNRR